MVRDDADHSGGAALSSIALLQERFRQLQRMKELRQERELVRTTSLSESKTERRSVAFSGASPPPRPHCQLALSLWPDSHAKRAPSDLAKPYHFPTLQSPHFNLESCDSDIDTSLRL